MRARIRRAVAPAIAAAAALAVMWLLGAGAGPLPALGPALVPVRGVWGSAVEAGLPHSQVLRLPGLRGVVRVEYGPTGVPALRAGNDHDLFLAQGYVVASFRLSEMDLERRFGEGRLAQLNGPSSVASDRFELQLGLLRTARAEWSATAPGSPAGRALLAYAHGVNDLIAQRRGSHELPIIYGLTGAGLAPWTPVDSLVVQEVLTQQLDFDTNPLDQAILAKSLGSRRAAAWFPVQPAGAQHPYDPGPYSYQGIAPLTVANANAAQPAPAAAAVADPGQPESGSPAGGSAAARAAESVLARIATLHAGAKRVHSDSNAWAVNAADATGAVAILAGDPHLALSLPSDWYELVLRSPDLSVSGASVPGLPAILLGRNRHISWSLTDVQNQSTFFYEERTSPAHPGEYYWKGSWHPFRQVRYTIPVRGGSTARVHVNLTVHGPIITLDGLTMSVGWMGSLPSPDLAVMLKVNAASDWAQFTAALRGWIAPTQNFGFASDKGDIGIHTAGYFPLVGTSQVAGGRRNPTAGTAASPAAAPREAAKPWLPMPGTGGSDITGVIPWTAVPQVYDPPGHVVATANQRPVAAGYPYYIGTALGYDPGFRANEIYSALTAGGAASESSFAKLQTSLTDYLAGQIVPRLLTALRSASLGGDSAAAARLLSRWDDSMTASSPAAAIWWTFWQRYLTDVFQPWWTAGSVPVHLDPDNLTLTREPGPLQEDLEQWTLHDPGNPAFTPPGGAARDAAAVMRTAFSQAVTSLARQLGGDPRTWEWGRVHSREIPSLTGIASLGYGPRPAGGDPRTVNAADNGMTSSFGPSWRMIVNWTGAGRGTAEAVYPGGQSDDPSSPWYQNFVSLWWNGRYLPLPPGPDQGTATWTLRPGGGS